MKKYGFEFYRLTVFILIAAFCLQTVGCTGKKGITPEADGSVMQETEYKPEYISLSDDSVILLSDVSFEDNILLWKTSKNHRKIFSFVPGTGSKKALAEIESLPDDLDITICCYGFSGENELDIIYREFDIDKQTSHIYFSKYDSAGKLVSTSPIKDEAFDPSETDSLPFQMKYDSSNDLIVALSKSSVYFINPSDLSIRTVKLDKEDSIWNLAASLDGIYVYGSDNRGDKWLARIEPDKMSVGEKIPLPSDTLGAGCSDIQDMVMLYSDKGLSLYDLKKGEAAGLCKWTDADVTGNSVSFVCYADSKIMAISNDYASNSAELIILSKRDSSGGEEPQELILANLYHFGGIAAAVNSYNRSQDKYKIKIVDYAEMTETDEVKLSDAINRMMLDMSGSNPPDLIDITYFINYSSGTDAPTVESLINKGYVYDLTPFIEKSGTLSPDDYDRNVLDICSYEGKVAAIPRCFYLKTLITDESYLDTENWSVSSLISLDEGHPDEGIVDNCGWETILELCLYHNIDFFIDEKTGKCGFDCDEFRKILEYAKKYSGNEDAYNFYRDKGLVRIIWTDHVEAMQYLAQLNYGGNTAFVGFPKIEQGSVTEIGISPNESALAICSRTKNAEASWDFIEYYLNRPFFKWITDPFASQSIDGIPSNKNVLQNYIEYLSSEDTPLNGGTISTDPSNIYHTYPLTKDEAERLYRLIEQSRPVTPTDKAVRMIIEEEVQPYFSGQKSIDDVIRIIQSRVQLDLDENP